MRHRLAVALWAFGAAALLTGCGSDDLAVPERYDGPVTVTYAGTGAIEDVFTMTLDEGVSVLDVGDDGRIYLEGETLTYCDLGEGTCRRGQPQGAAQLYLALARLLEDTTTRAAGVDWTDAADLTLAGREARCLSRADDEVSEYCYDLATNVPLRWREVFEGLDTEVQAIEVAPADAEDLQPELPVEDT